MTEQPDRILVLGTTANFRYIGIKPALSIEELESFPAPHGEGATLDNGVTLIEEYADNSTSIAFDKKAVPELFHDDTFKEYADRVLTFLGSAVLQNSKILPAWPGSIVNQSLKTEMHSKTLTSKAIFLS